MQNHLKIPVPTMFSYCASSTIWPDLNFFCLNIQRPACCCHTKTPKKWQHQVWYAMKKDKSPGKDHQTDWNKSLTKSIISFHSTSSHGHHKQQTFTKFSSPFPPLQISFLHYNVTWIYYGRVFCLCFVCLWGES